VAQPCVRELGNSHYAEDDTLFRVHYGRVAHILGRAARERALWHLSKIQSRILFEGNTSSELHVRRIVKRWLPKSCWLTTAAT
jgi:hypothetical protein